MTHNTVVVIGYDVDRSEIDCICSDEDTIVFVSCDCPDFVQNLRIDNLIFLGDCPAESRASFRAMWRHKPGG